ncbi:MAG: hypothetical protein ACFB2W_23130 [Leptolyngbyaceae cyanobacterium]|mgnify:CR=1 FL=1
MAGLFGLFGGKKNQSPQSKEAFFLSEDEAKTFGDIDYMRKEVVIRRTFAKKKGQAEEMESVKSISASAAKPVGEASKPSTSFASFGTSSFSAPAPAAEKPSTAPAPAAETPAAPEPKAAPARKSPDTSMDMFRNMAKKIGK